MTLLAGKRWLVLACLLAATGLLAAGLPSAPTVPIPADRLIQFLNQSISLYREAAIQERAAIRPGEQVLLYDNVRIAGQIVQFAFRFARARVDAMASESAAPGTAKAGEAPSGSGALGHMLARLDQDLQSTQQEEDSDKKMLARASGSKRVQLESTISELQGEIALAQARRDAVRNLVRFSFSSGSAATTLGASDLKAEINALAASVPTTLSGAASTGEARSASTAMAPTANVSAPSGIWGLAEDLFGLSSKIHTANSMIGETDSLLQTSDELRAPLVAQLRTLSTQGDQIARQADTANPATLAQEKQQLDGLAAEFKQVSAIAIPLSEQRDLMTLYRKNLVNWRNNVAAMYRSDLWNLGVRAGLLALVIALLFGLSEIWRRAVFRYVHDVRRRHQFLLLRKLTFWFVIALIVAITLAGRLSSFVTFAGLLTAGVAVALQNVILSVVGYFFLIGKFGIRVGDRVEVTGITGEVIDIGLVRFHLMELGDGSTPTGRVVAFSNSVVFQPTSGLFKQIPGARFAWHQVTLTVPRDADFASIKKHLLGAVENVLKDYRGEIDRLYGEMEKRGISFSEGELRPRLELRLSPAGIETIIRYPVDLSHASDIDARVSRELMTALEQDSKLQTAKGPEIHLKTDIPAGTPG